MTTAKYTVDDAVRAGVDRVKRDRELICVVYTDDSGDVVMCSNNDVRSQRRRLDAVIQWWDATNIQVRREGGASEWFNVDPFVHFAPQRNTACNMILPVGADHARTIDPSLVTCETCRTKLREQGYAV